MPSNPILSLSSPARWRAVAARSRAHRALATNDALAYAGPELQADGHMLVREAIYIRTGGFHNSVICGVTDSATEMRLFNRRSVQIPQSRRK